MSALHILAFLSVALALIACVAYEIYDWLHPLEKMEPVDEIELSATFGDQF